VDCMNKTRMALDRYKLYLTAGREYPYANEHDERNNIVELDADKVKSEDVSVNTDFSDVKHLKFAMRGMTLIIEKLITLRMKRATIQNVKDQLMLTSSITKAIDSFEEGYMRLGNIMRSIAEDNPQQYSPVETVESVNEDIVSEEVEKTNAIMEERASDAGEQTVAEETALAPEPSPEPDSNDNNSSPGE